MLGQLQFLRQLRWATFGGRFLRVASSLWPTLLYQIRALLLHPAAGFWIVGEHYTTFK